MYGFVDTIPGSGTGSTSLSIQTVFNGINLDEELTDENGSFITLTVSGRSNLTQKINTIEVPGMDGLIEQDGAKLEPREITVKYKISDRTNEGFRKRLDKLNSLLEGSKRELTFTDEDALFYATLLTNDIPEEESNNLVGTITFLCSDPFKYGPEKHAEFQDSGIVENEGTAEADPIFELTATAKSTFAMVSNGDEYMMVGRPYDENQQPMEKYNTVFVDNASTLVGWSAIPGGSNLDEGVVGGNMATNGYAFYAESFGTNPNGWVGPAVKKSLSRSIQDFRMTMDLELLNRQGNVGKVVVSLLDANDNVIASVQMVDATNSAWRNRAIIRAGSGANAVDILNHAPERGGWNDFRGVLRIERIGNEFRAYVARVVNGRHTGRLNRTYLDTLGQFQTPVTQVRVYIAKARNYEPFPMFFHGGNVWEVIDLNENQVPYIAHPGDVIEFNHKTGDVYINGESVPFDFGADFFTLKKGFNSLVVLPEGVFDTEVRFREKFK